jgi:Ras-related protein Rab-28
MDTQNYLTYHSILVKRMVLPGDVHVCLQIWDIGGQQIGGKMIGNYIFGAHAILLCYDISNYQSFQDLEDWLSLVRKTVPAAEKQPYMALVGTKSDLNHMRAIKPERHQAFADAQSLQSHFVSAKTGDNVQTSFYKVAADLAGVTLRKPDVEVAQKVVKAEIIDHQQNDSALGCYGEWDLGVHVVARVEYDLSGGVRSLDAERSKCVVKAP